MFGQNESNAGSFRTRETQMKTLQHNTRSQQNTSSDFFDDQAEERCLNCKVSFLEVALCLVRSITQVERYGQSPQYCSKKCRRQFRAKDVHTRNGP